MSISYDTMVKAMKSNDCLYDGRFYVGVRSTGIYCLPSCKAKLPLLKNVTFYSAREEAIADGLRGCRRCHSESYPDVLPAWLKQLVGYMHKHKTERLTEQRLGETTGVDITTIRRYFHTHLGTTALAFHRSVRIRYAKELIDSGADYLSAAFECGYESSSGFRSAFVRQYGHPPGSSHGSR